MTNVKHLIGRTGAAVTGALAGGAALVATPASAAGVADLATAVSFTDVLAAMVSVATLVVGVLVLWAGIKKIYQAAKSV